MQTLLRSMRFALCALALFAFGIEPSSADGTFPGLLQPGQVLGNNGTTPAPAGPMYPLPQNAQSSNYTAAISDCGKRITFNVTAQVTLTLNAGSSYPANCEISVSNVGYYNGPGTARGVILSVSGMTMPNQGNALYPGQTTVFSNSGTSSAWVETGYTQRQLWKPQNPPTFYVDCSAGSNTTSDGLGTGAGANLTIGQAFNRLSQFVDYSGGAAQATLSSTGNCPSGDGIHMAGPLIGAQGGAALVWNGNGTTTVNAAGGTNCVSTFLGAWILVINLSCQSSDGTGCFGAFWNSRILFASPASICNPGSGIGYTAQTFGAIEFQSGGLNFGSSSGPSSVVSLFAVQDFGQLIFDSAQTITFLGNVAFTVADISTAYGGDLRLAGSAFSVGSYTVSGTRFICQNYSILVAGSSPNTTIPGSSNGSIGPDCASNGTMGTVPASLGGTGYTAAPARSFRSLTAGSLGGVASAGYLQLGFKGSITPATSGNVQVTFTGEWFDNTNGDNCFGIVSYGTGTAPSSGAVATGTTAGIAERNGVTGVYAPLALSVYITGLIPGTTYWLDLQIHSSSSSDTCNVGALQAVAVEE
jgi:hypothetical protein